MKDQLVHNIIQSIKEDIQFPFKQKCSGMTILSLDQESYQKYDQLKKYLKDVQMILDTKINDLDNVSKKSELNQQRLKELSEYKEECLKNIEMIKTSIENTLVEKKKKQYDYDKLLDNIKIEKAKEKELENLLKNKKNKLKQAWIPIYDWVILKKKSLFAQ